MSGSSTFDPVEMLAAMLRGGSVSSAQLLSAAASANLDLGAASAAPAVVRAVPTVAEFYATVSAAARDADDDEDRGGGMFRTYEPYWRLLVEGYPYQHKGWVSKSGRVGADPVPTAEKLYEGLGERRVDEIVQSDLEEAARWVERRAKLDAHWKTVRREDEGRPARRYNQNGAYANFHGAMRYFFNLAVGDRHIDDSLDPTARLSRPKASESTRRAFVDWELEELWQATVSGGDDPWLDSLIVETVLVTAARREGLLNLRLRDLDRSRASIWLHEKGGQTTEQPATVDLVNRLFEFANSRGAVAPSDPVFCAKSSKAGKPPKPITSRRFDTLHNRLQKTLPWADKLGVTIHWARHHSVTQVQRIAGSAVSARYARHKNTSTTARYEKATGEEVCAAISIMTGHRHPLCDGGW